MVGIVKERFATSNNVSQQVDRWLWQWCLDEETLFRLCILIALALLSSLAVPQFPTHARLGSLSFAQWVETLPAPYQAWSSFLDAVGLFGVFTTPWFHILLACTAFVSLVALGERVHSLSRPSASERESFHGALDVVTIHSSQSFPSVVSAVGEAMAALGTSQQTSQHGQVFRAVRRRWVRLLHSLVYVGLLLVVCGLAVEGRWGWYQGGAHIPPEEPARTDVGTAGQPELVRLDGERLEATIETAGGRQLTLRKNARVCTGRFCYQLAEKGGPLVQVSAEGGGRPGVDLVALYTDTTRSEPVELLEFVFSSSTVRPGDESRLFVVPDHQLIGQLEWLNRVDLEQPVLGLTVLDEGSQVLAREEIATQDSTVSISAGEVTFSLKVSHSALIDIWYHPGLGAVAAGFAALAIGSAATLVPRQEVWASVVQEPDRVVVRIRERSSGYSPAWQRTLLAALIDLRTRLERSPAEEVMS